MESCFLKYFEWMTKKHWILKLSVLKEKQRESFDELQILLWTAAFKYFEHTTRNKTIVKHLINSVPLKTSTMDIAAKMVSNFYRKLLTILPNRPNLDTWLGLECTSTDGYNIVLKIQRYISPWQQVEMSSF